MRRRDFIRLLGVVAAAWPLAAQAQQAAMPVVGFLSGRSPRDSAAMVAAFHRGLGELGFLDGQNIEVDFRWALGHYDQLPALAADLIRRKVSVIIATGGGITSGQAAKAATATIPIVFVAGTDPVASGLVPSLNNPGGNVTGIFFLIGALIAKKFELLNELVPSARVFGVLANPDFPDTEIQVRDAKVAAQALGQKLVIANARTAGELESAFAMLAQQQVKALIVAADPFLNAHTERLAVLAMRYALPTVHSGREHVLAGALMSYGTSITDAHRQAGVYVGRSLNGTPPGALPVIQPTKFELAINVNTAKALGLDVPPTLLARADEVIE
jgi:putative ABC transport system substrate-binding protein